MLNYIMLNAWFTFTFIQFVNDILSSMYAYRDIP